MGLPIYQIESYQKAPPKVKHTGITQKSPKLVLATEKHQMSAKKSTKSTKIIRTLEQPLQN